MKRIKLNLSCYTLMIILLSSCANYTCILDVDLYSKSNCKKAIQINSIENTNKGCMYDIKGYFRFNDRDYIGKGKMHIQDSTFFIQLREPKIRKVKFFNLTIGVGEQYDEVVLIDEKKLKFQFKLSDKLKKGKELICRFRFLQSSLNNDFDLDIVYIVSLDRGIIGTYFSKFDKDGIELIINREGDILEQNFDYSGCKFRVMK